MTKYFYYFSIYVLLFRGYSSLASDQVNELIKSIKNEQQRIDQLDKKIDGSVTLKSDIQSKQATYVYLELSRDIVVNIAQDFSLSIDQKINQLKTIENSLNSVGTRNIHLYTQFSPSFELVLKIQEIKDTRRLKNILNSNVLTSLDCIPFFINYNISQSFLLEAVHVEPSKVLENYKQFKHKAYSNYILDEAAMIAPMKIKTYLHSWNSIHKQIKESKNQTTKVMYDIYEEVGPISRAYILLNDIITNRLSISEAHQISKTDKSLNLKCLTKR